jgi:hypothetical protein
MSEEGMKRSWVRRRLPAVLVALALGVAGVAWAGCGDDGNDETVDTEEIKQRFKKAIEEAKAGAQEGGEKAREGVEKGAEEAKKGIEEGTEEAEKGIEKGKEEAQKGIEEGEKYEDRYSP